LLSFGFFFFFFFIKIILFDRQTLAEYDINL